MSDLILVVDPDYADRLETAAQRAPVWVVATQANRDAFERLCKLHPHPDHRDKGAVTCFKTLNLEDRLGSLEGILAQLETHHGEVDGEYLVFPSGFVLEVIGLPLAPNVMTALKEFGFTSFSETSEGFQARRVETSVDRGKLSEF